MPTKPLISEYPEYYRIYIENLPQAGILDYLETQTESVVKLYKNLTKQQLEYRYRENKWSIKEILGHLLDSEIIFAYRALTYARGDKTNLPMYNHDEYAKNFDSQTINSSLLITQYRVTREANLLLFKTFTEKEWQQKGITGGKTFTTRSIPYITAGHTNHHLKVIKEKYL